MTDAATDAPTPDLPPPPRPVTARARRRSWAELPVRTWAVLAAVVGAITLYLAVARVAAALGDRELIERGTLVEATVVELRGTSATSLRRDGRVDVTLSVPTPAAEPDGGPGDQPGGGAVTQFAATLPPAPGETIRAGQTVPVRVDPSNAARRTAETQGRPWAQELIGPILLAPVVLALAALAWAKRRGVIAAWRDGSPMVGTVTEVRQSPLAPRSRLVRYTVPGGRGTDAVLRPDRLGPVAPGDTLELVGRPGRAVLASLYR